ncbi:hypothetical protein [Mycobacterium sp. DL99]|uniref:hypothetical protein n=1 Tax=Mycobacterium sp. DL99 TaxID=2528957 RepID=UPI0010814C81|nr:hypothetical protein [Mycobacterium sp. DL99]
MTRHYSPYDTTPTERFGDHSHEPGGYSDYTTDYSTDAESDYGYDADYDDEVTFYEDPIDRRWIWVAAVAGAILLIAVICTVVILGGGDSGSVSATLTSPSAQPTQTTQPAQDATSKPVPPAAPTAPLSPETVTTLTPAPSATATPAPAPPAAAEPPAGIATPTAVTYRVTGNRQLIDLVTIVYTDEQGALQTDINVALPWAKTVVLNPGVTLKSVTATSVAGQLNCSITDASGAVLVAQANNTMITTCTQ